MLYFYSLLIYNHRRKKHRGSVLPTILREGKYRFFFFSNEGSEPPHIHVESEGNYVKFSLSPVTLMKSVGYNSTELNRLRHLVEQKESVLMEKWNEYFAG